MARGQTDRRLYHVAADGTASMRASPSTPEGRASPVMPVMHFRAASGNSIRSTLVHKVLYRVCCLQRRCNPWPPVFRHHQIGGTHAHLETFCNYILYLQIALDKQITYDADAAELCDSFPLDSAVIDGPQQHGRGGGKSWRIGAKVGAVLR